MTCLVYAAQMGEIVSFELYNKNDERLPWYDTNGNEHENFTYSANRYINAVTVVGICRNKVKHFNQVLS